MEVVTKRLHVSGLTPQISSTDLKARFSSFGNVKALDGLGKLDALGQPRPYAYVTLEATEPQLAKCLNLLSGTTWKGARLRIGEARPDFSERIIKENEAVNGKETRPAKRRRLARGAQGVHASDMSLVTTTFVRPGWRVTPLGRLVRPMRMRPLRPLATPIVSGAQKLAEYKKKRKDKKKALLVRARRRRIDPEDWGSSYLSKIMLESGSGVILPERTGKTRDSREAASVANTGDGESAAGIIPEPRHPESPSPLPTPIPPVAVPPDTPVVNDESHPGPAIDLTQEAAHSLTLLNSLFGSGANGRLSNEDDDWGGAESLSDFELDAETSARATGGLEGMDEGIEFVPREMPIKTSKAKEKRASGSEEDSIEIGADEPPAKEVSEPQVQTKVQMTKLKDMFTPRAEEAEFSILGNLDLDLELDEVLPTVSAPMSLPPHQALESDSHPSLPAASVSASYQSTFTFDPARPFFFPHSLTSHSPLSTRPGAPRDLFSGTPDFYRTDDSDTIRARWVARKVELTRDWKRRHREAVKSARRRGGTQD